MQHSDAQHDRASNDGAMARQDALITGDGNDYRTDRRAQHRAEDGVLGDAAIAPARFIGRANCPGSHSPDGGAP